MGNSKVNMERSLVVLAAGIGSRFVGGVKQLQSAGPSGELIMDYSIHDALEAGFNRIVFIIRHDIQQLFDEQIGNRIRRVCESRGVEVVCAYQEKENLPGGYVCPAERTKPWGTGHALLSCKGLLNGPFLVINADDYYGKDAYRKAMDFLNSLADAPENTYGLIGFCLANTLSENGGVTRGLCSVDEEGWLRSIRETKNVVKTREGAAVATAEGLLSLDPETPVSMNMWCFPPEVLEQIEEGFLLFLAQRRDEPGSEYLIPTMMGYLLDRGAARVKVLPTDSHWFGMTYAADMPAVREAFREMAEKKIYSDPLFE